MPLLTFAIVDGIDKGRVFRELPTPVTIGREEGNILRLNDERVSRFHAKVQFDNGEVILTDLDSTNGTRVNGNVVQIRRLKPGDRIGVGRSLLRFGSDEEITERQRQLSSLSTATPGSAAVTAMPPTVHAQTLASQFNHDDDCSLSPLEKVTVTGGELFIGSRPLPSLPQKLTPSQRARLAELIEFLHRQLSAATENIVADDNATSITLSFADWQRILGLQMVLARYVRAAAEPDVVE